MGSAEIDKLIGRLRQYRDWVKQGRVVREIVELGKPAVPGLIEALSDDDGFVRSGAAEALGQIGDLRAVEPLIAALALPADSGDGEHVEACVQIVTALDRLGDSRAITPLIRWLPAFLDPIPAGGWCVAWYIIEALGILGAVEALPLIAPLIEHPDLDVRKSAAIALKRLHDKRGG